MLKHHLAYALLGTALLSAPALAQSNQPAGNQPAVNQPGSGASGKFLTEARPDQWRTFKLRGLDVYNPGNERVGDIRELLQTRDGKIDAVVIGVGGFLGLGEHDVALPYSDLQWSESGRTASTSATDANAPADRTNPNQPVTTTGSTTRTSGGYPDHAIINYTREQLRAAPEFRFPR
jgi:hypothetical protein